MSEIKVHPMAVRPFFTMKTLSQYLSISERTIRDMIRSGEIASYKIGGSRRIAPEDVESWLECHRDESRRVA